MNRKELESITTQSFKKLKDFIGQEVVVELGLYTFCTEEDHSPHYWSPHGTNERVSMEVTLEGVSVFEEQLFIRRQKGKVETLHFCSKGSSSIGSYSKWYIDRVFCEGKEIFSAEVIYIENQGHVVYLKEAGGGK